MDSCLPGAREVVVCQDDAVEKHPAYTVWEHGRKGLTQDCTVGSAPETQLAVFIEGVHDLEHIAGNERRAIQVTGVLEGHVARVGYDTSVMPCFGFQ